MGQTILLNNRPEGTPNLGNFKFEEQSVGDPQEGELLVKSKYVSVDPYLRGRMNDTKSYVPPFEVGKPLTSGIIAEVIESKHPDYKAGDYVSKVMPWKTLQVITTEDLHKVDASKAPLSAYLGILGMTGLTAYTGLTEIGKPKENETLLVSGAAGAVGSIVGQIGKLLGLRVVGIAGSDEKINMLKQNFNFDAGINYKTTDDLTAAIIEHCPEGVDIYFDNVGGEISDAVLYHINKYARIINCGAIAVYNETTIPKSLSVQPFLIKNSALMQGFIVSNYASKFEEAIAQLAEWLKQEKLVYTETIVEGFENIPQAFLDLFDGKNKGKMIIKI
ncbi:MAG: NADP-dependent oxidoreductase [Leeuwenhoekiella sp.]|uniref:NADP-dependent oxidoreductase n=1 Tax=Leeuwenhoekiella palythoae TaxID=573501 RepID=UPI000C560BE0|nr:NADP-dependent oxidoreductase [Leeuwenhoekiella palythoae]MAS20260.1 NADP-dependent oxidoreductase [Leeuwenhoekiella sp.]MBH13497.1 NADP-dependent oxidoreductase [Leeuwenhoekiella sp.]UBZ09812.1 NADP-dependent oxidoreductase [Leeuwenhoekiella palythoae]HBO29402.1 NADP-dependent oxidoreductase [Leeuwenhoekiella sp.]|tara:strand:- start:865 stop:1860 length:996 start_codon:yes stop_codon:yes gene_type:complete